MSNLKRNIEKKQIIIIIVLLILVIISLILYSKNVVEDNEKNNINNKTTISESEEKAQTVEVPKTNEEIIKKLSTLNERDRMEYYCGEYFKHIEKHEYEQAYNLLYTEFKQKYFPTIEEFEEYVKKTYPKAWALDYDDITRQGDIYVLRLKIYDVLGSRENEKIQRIVIKENYYNDFVISFQVI